jgi:hypothetical protein
LLAAALPAALARLVLPRGVWLFRRRRTAAVYLVPWLAAAALAAAMLVPREFSTPDSAGAGLSAPTPAGAATAAISGQGSAPAGGATASTGAAGADVPVQPQETTGTPAPAAGAAAGESGAPSSAAPPTAAPPPPSPSRVAIGNTGGEGAALRRTPRWADRITGVAYGERTVLTVLEDGITGDDGQSGSAPWLRVRDATGREGYVPARFTLPAP